MQIIINSFDFPEVAKSILKREEEKPPSNDVRIIWDLKGKRVIYYEGNCKHIIPFPSELVISDSAYKAGLERRFSKK